MSDLIVIIHNNTCCKPAGWMRGMVKGVIFLDTMRIINVKFCMLVLPVHTTFSDIFDISRSQLHA